MKLKIIYLAILLFCFSAKGKAQDCSGLIKDYLKRMSVYSKPDSSVSLYMTMSVDTKYKASSEIKDSYVLTTLQIAGKKMQYESDYISYYADQNEAFTIVHPQKTIIRANSGQTGGYGERYKAVMTLHDTLIAHSRMSACKDTEIQGRKLKEISFSTDAVFQKATGVSQITYYYDIKEERVWKSLIRYNEKSSKKQEIITYDKLSFDSKKEPFDKASRKVMQGNSLLAKYKGFEFIDNRKISKR